MHHRHFGGRHPRGFHFLIKFMFIMLVIGALFTAKGHRGNGSQAAYWQGFQAGVASITQGGETAEPGTNIPPVPPFDHMERGWGGPGFGALLFVPICGMALFAFMGFLYAIANVGRRGRGSKGGMGPWGRGCWGDDDMPNGRKVSDDEVGPEKSPEDII